MASGPRRSRSRLHRRHDLDAVADVPEFARAPGAAGYAANTTVNFGGVEAKYVKLTITSQLGRYRAAGRLERSTVLLRARTGPPPAAGDRRHGCGPSIRPWVGGPDARPATTRCIFSTDPNAGRARYGSGRTVRRHSFDPGGSPDGQDLLLEWTMSTRCDSDDLAGRGLELLHRGGPAGGRHESYNETR